MYGPKRGTPEAVTTKMTIAIIVIVIIIIIITKIVVLST